MPEKPAAPSTEPATAGELAETVMRGAHFYMAHRMREYPHPNAPDITVAEHVPGRDGCPGCKAIEALAELVARAEADRGREPSC